MTSHLGEKPQLIAKSGSEPQLSGSEPQLSDRKVTLCHITSNKVNEMNGVKVTQMNEVNLIQMNEMNEVSPMNGMNVTVREVNEVNSLKRSFLSRLTWSFGTRGVKFKVSVQI